MAGIVQSYSTAGSVTKPTMAGVPQAQVVALTDGEGNLAGPSVGATAFITLPSAAQAPANTGTPFVTSPGGATSIAVDITVSGFTGGTSPSVTFFIDRQGADTAWDRVWASAAISAAGPTSASVGPGQTTSAVLAGTARFGWTTTGTPTAVTFSASVVGRP